MTAEPRIQRTAAEEDLARMFAAARASLPGGAAARARRDAAFSTFSRFGLPHRRIEAWKYTDLRALMRSAAPLADAAGAADLDAAAAADPLAGLDRARIVVANGRFRPDLSDLGGTDGVAVESLADVLAASPARIGWLLDDGEDTAAALNTAMMQGGVMIVVRPEAKPGRPIEIAHLTAAGEPVSTFSRDVVEVGANASVRFVESHRGPAGVGYQVNTAAELDVATGAKVVWVRLQAEGDAAQHVAGFAARLMGEASLDHLAVNAGGRLMRWQGRVDVAGRGARVGFFGATMLSGDAHHDTMLVLNHVEPGSGSRELFKAVVDGRAHGAFQGRIVVKPGAQKTDARMMAQTLLLSDEAQFAAKPELEIFADDVQCGHGATSGRIDDTMLFYLMSRGLPRAAAERLLVEAFLDDAIDAAGDAAIGDALKALVSGWLDRRAGGP